MWAAFLRDSNALYVKPVGYGVALEALVSGISQVSRLYIAAPSFSSGPLPNLCVRMEGETWPARC